MSDPVLDPSDAALFLGLPSPLDAVTESKLEFLIEVAQELCETIVTPCPVTARSVVLGVVARALANPTNAESQTVGPFAVSFGASAAGGLYLTTQDRATLKRIAGRGGAFTFDPTPADAGQGLAPWDLNVSWWGGVPLAGDVDGVDS